MKERDFQQQIIDAARLCGWQVAHFRTAMNQRGRYMTPVGADGKGFPDLCLVRDRVVFAELKVGRRQLEPEQQVWRDRILQAGVEHYVWRPDDLDRVIAVLRDRRPAKAAA